MDVAVGEGPQVHPGAERLLARSRQHDDPDRRVGLGRDDGAAEVAEQTEVEGVARLGPVEAEDQDRAAALLDQIGLTAAHDR